MHPNDTQVLDRLIRMESRIVQLGDFVGANLRTKQRIEIIKSAAGTAVEVDALDVSLSRIFTELRQRGAEPGLIPVYLNHVLIGNLKYAVGK